MGLKGLKAPKLPKPPKNIPKPPKIDLPSTKPPKIDLPTTKPPKIDMPTTKPPKIDMPNTKPPKPIVEAPYKPPKADAPNTKPPKADAPDAKPKKSLKDKIKDAGKKGVKNADEALEIYNAGKEIFGDSDDGEAQNNNDGNEGAGQPVEEKPAQENQDPLTKPLEDKANSGGVQAAAQNVMAGQGDNENKPSRDSYLNALSLVNRYEAYGCQQPSKKPNPVEKKRKYDF